MKRHHFLAGVLLSGLALVACAGNGDAATGELPDFGDYAQGVPGTYGNPPGGGSVPGSPYDPTPGGQGAPGGAYQPPPGGGPSVEVCVQICEAFARLGCEDAPEDAAACGLACAAIAGEACSSELFALYACIVASGFTCTDGGDIELPDGACVNEGTAYSRCRSQGAGGNGGNGGAGGGAGTAGTGGAGGTSGGACSPADQCTGCPDLCTECLCDTGGDIELCSSTCN
jgi:hypothetical protein